MWKYFSILKYFLELYFLLKKILTFAETPNDGVTDRTNNCSINNEQEFVCIEMQKGMMILCYMPLLYSSFKLFKLFFII